jgi:hypothetical protein
MPVTYTKLRFSWIAVAALAGASLLDVDARAACTSMPNAGKCRPGCCGKAVPTAMPIRAAGLATVGRQVASLDENTCRNVPGCNCCPQAPTAPEPKERRAEASTSDGGRTVESDWFDLDQVFRPFIGAVAPAISPPQKSPLYLRNSRLLI